MNRSEMLTVFRPALDYWSKTLTEEVVEVYFNELRDYESDVVARAILQCVREDKYFPRLADLLPKLGAKLRRESITTNAELLRYNEICGRSVDGNCEDVDWSNGETTRYPLDRIIAEGHKVKAAAIADGRDERVATSFAVSHMWVRNIEQFERHVGKSWRPSAPLQADTSGPRSGMTNVGEVNLNEMLKTGPMSEDRARIILEGEK